MPDPVSDDEYMFFGCSVVIIAVVIGLAICLSMLFQTWAFIAGASVACSPFAIFWIVTIIKVRKDKS